MKHYISTARLNTYRSILKLKDDDQILKAYYWNKALCGAIYPAMQTLEVTLRNALNEAVKTHHEGLYQGKDWWFEHIARDIQNKKISKMSPSKTKIWLKPDGQRKKQSYAEQSVLRIQKELKEEGRLPILHDDVISRVTFGYWVAVLGKDYEDVTRKTLLWPNLLEHVFPHSTYAPKRAKIEAALRRIKDLRNRMSHHEPIWKFYKLNSDGKPIYNQPIYGLTTSLTLLEKAYDEVLSVVKSMSIDRYQSFIGGKLDVEFKKLCSINGFYGFVNPDKMSTKVTQTRIKREFVKYVKASQAGKITAITTNGTVQWVLGLNEPDI